MPQGSRLCLSEGGKQDHTPRAPWRKNFFPLFTFEEKTVASKQSAEDSEPDHLKQGLDTHPRVCSGEEEDSGGGVWLGKPHVPSRQSDPALCVFDNQFTFPDPMLALKIHKPPFLSAGAQSVIKAIGVDRADAW